MDTKPTLVRTEIRGSSIVWSCCPSGRDEKMFQEGGDRLMIEVEIFFAELVKVLVEKKSRFESKIHPGYSFEVILHP